MSHMSFFNIEVFSNYGIVHVNVATYICNISDMTDTNFTCSSCRYNWMVLKYLNSLTNIIVKFNLEQRIP